MQNKCRKTCGVEYEVDEPLILPPPERFNELGLSEDEPA